MKKGIPIFAFVIFLVVIPLFTWLNLRKGLDYRLQLRNELVVKDSVDLKLDTLHLLSNKTNILILKSFDRVNDFVSAIDEHFSKEQSVNFYSNGFIHESFHVLPEGYFLDIINKYDRQTFILVDTSGYIRNTYSDKSEDIGKLLEHTAVLIPGKKRPTIELKSQKGKVDE